MKASPPAGDRTRTRAFELLVACGRNAHRPERIDAVANTIAGVEWDAFLSLVAQHAATPHAWLCLAQHPLVPEGVRAEVRARQSVVTRHSLRLASVLAQAARAFQAEGIRVTALKGPALARHLLGDPTLRQCSDVDLLVDRADVARADAVLRSLGFTPSIPNFERRLHRRYFTTFLHELQYVDWKRGVLVELHWRVVLNPYLLRLPRGWPLATDPVTVGGTTVPILDTCDQILYLAEHASSHSWSELRWLFDFPPLLERLESMGTLEQRAREAGSWPVVQDMLALCREVLGMAMELSPAKETDRASRARLSAAHEAIRGNRALLGAPRFRKGRFRSRPGRGLRYRIFELAAPVFHAPADWQQFPLPAPLLPFYAPLRPIFKRIRDARAAAGAPQVVRLRDHFPDGPPP